jgi:hypothetical protein
MAPIFHPKGNRGFVYDVIVTTNETVRLSLRYRAHSSNSEPVGNGRLVSVQIDGGQERPDRRRGRGVRVRQPRKSGVDIGIALVAGPGP